MYEICPDKRKEPGRIKAKVSFASRRKSKELPSEKPSKPHDYQADKALIESNRAALLKEKSPFLVSFFEHNPTLLDFLSNQIFFLSNARCLDLN